MLKARLICWILNLVSNDWEVRMKHVVLAVVITTAQSLREKSTDFVGHKCPTYGINNAHF